MLEDVAAFHHLDHPAAHDVRGVVAMNGLTVQLPLNPIVAPPGDYMLFIVNGIGVPGVAAIVSVR